MDYPVFAPPIEIASKQPKEWSNSEAETYCNWFLNNLTLRTNGLLVFLGLNEMKQQASLLTTAQEKVEQLLSSAQFVIESSEGRKLTNQGYALAADLGLLVAQLLITQGQGKVTWKILKKPKTDRSYNLPILIGFGEIEFDPIAVSIADATWIARGNQKPGAWRKTYDFLVSKGGL